MREAREEGGFWLPKDAKEGCAAESAEGMLVVWRFREVRRRRRLALADRIVQLGGGHVGSCGSAEAGGGDGGGRGERTGSCGCARTARTAFEDAEVACRS